MSTFTLAISCLTTSNLPCHGPNIPGSYVILLFTASDLASVTSHIHNWVLFLLWPHRFIFSGVISPLISSSLLGTYLPGEFIFHCPIFLSFHTVHGVLKARILKWFAIPFCSGPHSVRTLHHDQSVLGAPHGLAHGFTELWSMWSDWLVFCDCGLLMLIILLPILKYCFCCLVTQSCLTLCDTMDCSTPGLPVHHQLP